MSENITQAVGEMASAFEEFKKANDERLDRLEKGQGSDPLVEDKLSKIEKSLDSLENINQSLTQSEAKQQAISEKVDQLETVLSRPNTGMDTKSVDATVKAFDTFIRKGKENLSDVERKALTVSIRPPLF